MFRVSHLCPLQCVFKTVLHHLVELVLVLLLRLGKASLHLLLEDPHPLKWEVRHLQGHLEACKPLVQDFTSNNPLLLDPHKCSNLHLLVQEQHLVQHPRLMPHSTTRILTLMSRFQIDWSGSLPIRWHKPHSLQQEQKFHLEP